MAVRYTVVPNTVQPGQFYPRTVTDNTRDLDTLIRNVSKKTAMQRPDVEAVTSAFIDEIVDGLVDGDRVSIDGLADFAVRLSQVLESAEDRFNSEAGGDLLIAATAKPQLADAVRKNAHLEKVFRGTKAPMPVGFRDAASNTRDQYTPGAMGIVAGNNLKIGDEGAPEQGIFFIAAADGTENKVTVFGTNTNRRLMFDIPAGLTGQQRVEIRTRYTQDGELRKGELSGVLNPA